MTTPSLWKKEIRNRLKIFPVIQMNPLNILLELSFDRLMDIENFLVTSDFLSSDTTKLYGYNYQLVKKKTHLNSNITNLGWTQDQSESKKGLDDIIELKRKDTH